MSGGTEIVSVLGVPWDEHSSYLRGPAGAPEAIRAALQSASSNLSTESGVDLARHEGWEDLGDLDGLSGPGAFAQIEQSVSEHVEAGRRLLALGGDHAVSYPVIRGVADRFSELTVLHLDAHPDLYDTLDGDRLSHACPFARIMEEGLVARLVQVGIRTMNPHQRAQASRFGVEVIEMRHLDRVHDLELSGPIYVSFDMDVLDPAFAPGVSHHEPGGLSTRQALNIIQSLPPEIVGADVVELNPLRDPSGITAMAAAKVVKELLAKLLASAAT
ncbi:MAG: agmatinase [Gemmatimonadetes bacterium]|nr:agmatinase [Gemmatimonadota bacterium]